jgi:CPA2 family monovalent cation:H+ antiporter-2
VLHERTIPFVVIELDPAREKEMHTSEIPVIFGDASRTPILEAAGAERAKLCVVLMNEYESISRVVLRVRELNPTLQVIVRTRYFADSERLREAGADIIVPEELETTVRIFSHVLGAYMIPPAEIERHVKALRSQDYGVLRGSIQEAHLMVLEGLDEDGMHTRAVAVRKGTPADGKTLAELALRQAHGLTVIAVRRKDRTRSNPSGDFRVEAGDRLVLIGTAERFAECAWLFRRED